MIRLAPKTNADRQPRPEISGELRVGIKSPQREENSIVMGALIHLIPPAPSFPDAAKVYYAVGRALSASDFAQQDRYIDARLLGLTPTNLGVISGLGVSPQRYDNWPTSTAVSSAAAATPTTFTVGPGTGIGADGRLVSLSQPLSFSWQGLLQTSTPANTIPTACIS